MLISFVMPCYNEAGNVRAMHDEILRVFTGSAFEVELVYADDGSTDETAAELKRLHAENRLPVKVISFSRNFGKESAIYAGLEHAAGDLTVIIDADLQQPPEVALFMAQHLLRNDEYDCVCACQEARRESKVTALLKRGFYKLMNRLTEIEFVDGASDFRCMRRSMVDAILSMSERNRFSKGLFSWVGFSTKYIPYTARERNAGSTKWNTFKLFKYAFDGIVSFSSMPLRIASFAGVLSAAAALIYMIVVIIQKLAFDIPVPGYATIVTLILFLGGIQLFAMGILGEYMAKAYSETKKRPIYIARTVLLPPETQTKENAQR
ncbi:MAG: glycosyltransferase family 2 protein [Oscillospiraceae bacterium]|jgi:glycosyltransferase involved in cell wall biosynthesis|nr:glycosyltransferase family 2 protein [Oscillospiraceae bacterium]